MLRIIPLEQGMNTKKLPVFREFFLCPDLLFQQGPEFFYGVSKNIQGGVDRFRRGQIDTGISHYIQNVL
jgi:hypothetical protein